MQGATNHGPDQAGHPQLHGQIPVCTHYELDGQQTDEFPFPAVLDQAKPVVEYVPGWKCDISGVRKLGGSAPGGTGLCGAD
jgi:adenylosuccinate synthase